MAGQFGGNDRDRVHAGQRSRPLMMTAVDADKEQKLREQLQALIDHSIDYMLVQGTPELGMVSIIASARSTLAALGERAAQQDQEQP